MKKEEKMFHIKKKKDSKEIHDLIHNASWSQEWKCSMENIVNVSVASFYVDRK